MTYMLFRVFKWNWTSQNHFGAGWYTDHFIELPDTFDLDIPAMALRFVTAERFLHNDDTLFPRVTVYQLSETLPLNEVTPCWIVWPERRTYTTDESMFPGYRGDPYLEQFLSLRLMRNRVKGPAHYEEHHCTLVRDDFATTTGVGLARGRWVLKPKSPAADHCFLQYRAAIENIPFVCHNVSMDKDGRAVVWPDATGRLMVRSGHRSYKKWRIHQTGGESIYTYCGVRWERIFSVCRFAHQYYKQWNPGEHFIFSTSHDGQMREWLNYAEGIASVWRNFAQMLGWNGADVVPQTGGIIGSLDVNAPPQYRGKATLTNDNGAVLEILNHLKAVQESTTVYKAKLDALDLYYTEDQAVWVPMQKQVFDLVPDALAHLHIAIELVTLLHAVWHIERKNAIKGTKGVDFRNLDLGPAHLVRFYAAREDFDIEPMWMPRWPISFLFPLTLPPDTAVVEYQPERETQGQFQLTRDRANQPQRPPGDEEWLPNKFRDIQRRIRKGINRVAGWLDDALTGGGSVTK